MKEKKIVLRVITPVGVKVDEKVDMVIMRCTTGDMGILPGHSPYSAVLDYGVLRILDLDDENERRMAVYGGLAEIKNDLLTIMTKGAEWPEDIDRANAEANREYAEQRLQAKTEDVELQSEQVMLRRSLVQIEVSSYPLVSKSQQTHSAKPKTENVK